MEEFIAESKISKNALNMASLASTLPVQVLIFGEVGTGKGALAKIVAPNTEIYEATELESILKHSPVEKSESVIALNIDRVNNAKQFVEKLKSRYVKVVATARSEKSSFKDNFSVRIDLPPLSQRKEDLQALLELYLKEANTLFNTNISSKSIEIDLSKNAYSLKSSIYRSVILNSVNRDQILLLFENFLTKEIDNRCKYRELIELFEIPLIHASRKKFKSQLKMSQKLEINRNTLRKKINQYGLGER